MQATDDIVLLREYAKSRSESAFERLVSRYVRLVYWAALRQMRDPFLAEEVTQAVFIILAQKAGRISDRTILSGWLFRTTHFVALAQRRSAAVRRQHEEEFRMQPDAPPNTPDPAWEQIAPLLDEGLVQLDNEARQAILLRYFEGKSLAEVGGSLGVGEDAARMRISRALEKLRGFFLKRGVNSTGAVIAGAITANAGQAVPAALIKTITAAAVVKGAAAGSSTLTLIKGALRIMAWTKAKTAIVAGACVLLAAGTTTIVICNKPKPVQGIPQDWSVLQGDRAQWNWANNAINGRSTTGSTMLVSNKKYGDVTMSVIAGSTNRGAELVIRMQDADNGYMVSFSPDGTAWSAENGSCIKLMKKTSGDEVELGIFKRGGLALPGHSAKITVTAKGPWIEVFLNEDSVLKVKDTTYASGYIGLRVYGDTIKPSDATYSNLTID